MKNPLGNPREMSDCFLMCGMGLQLVKLKNSLLWIQYFSFDLITVYIMFFTNIQKLSFIYPSNLR